MEGVLKGTEDEGGGANESLNTQIAGLEAEAGAPDPKPALAHAQALQKKVRKAYSSLYEARWVNVVDDLALFLSEPDPGAEVRKRYAALRFRFLNQSAIGGGYEDVGKDVDEALQKDIKAALSDPAVKPVADYFEFLNLAVTANHFVFVNLDPKAKKPEGDSKDEDTYRTRDYPQMVTAAQGFLAKYPKSKKREAAMLLYARAVYRNSEQIALPKTVTWPQAPRWEGGNQPTLTQREAFDPKRVLGALDAYDKAYPHGRYAADIRNYRAAVALRQHEWKAALDLTLAQLDGQENPGLNHEAADRLGDLFAHLADERDRIDVLATIKENKRAKELLEAYLAFDSDQHPLLYMKTWVRQQLAGK
jgi:hypothetical protein